jgi:hypothetical protein
MNQNTPNNQVTLNQIIDVLKNDIAGKFKTINSFYSGDIANYRPLSNIYPLLYVHYDKVTYKPNELEYHFNLFVLDRLETDYSNQDEVYSDTLQTLNNIRSLLKFGSAYYQLFRLDDNVDANKVTDKINDDLVCGWQLNLKVRTDFVYDICNIPTK